MKKKNSFLSWRHSIVLWILGIPPSIQLVALCNSRAMEEHSENSDIDLFIITKCGQLWIGRLLVTVISSLLGIRRQNTHGLIKGSPEYIKKTKNKFCLSFFITEDAMNLNTIRIENDIYLDTWIKNLIPLVNKNNTLERFLVANGVGGSPEKEKTQKFLQFVLCILYSVFGILESIIKKLWLPRTIRTYQKLGRPWGVVISDTMLKFHDNDQRKLYRDAHIKE